MTTLKIDNFNLQQIADSGQCFRMNRMENGGYSVISGGRYLEVFQDGPMVSFNCPQVDISFWKDYFDLDTDYGFIMNSVQAGDRYLVQAAREGSGIRILRQDSWEMIITFILSQQKTIPKIKEAVEALCRSYGLEKTAEYEDPGQSYEKKTITYYSFPDAKQLSAASLDELKSLKLGYRAKYIYRIVSDCMEGLLDLSLLNNMTYEKALEYLSGFYGIGIKIASCICLFGLHHVEAFPVDTWIMQILDRHYYSDKYDGLPKSRLYPAMVADCFGCYKGFAGVMQQYIFYYERVVVQGKG